MDPGRATTTLRGGHPRAPSTQAVDIHEDDALHRVAHELAGGIARPRREALEHALEPTMRGTDVVEPDGPAEHAHPPPQRAPASSRLLAHHLEGAHLAPSLGRAHPLPPAAERPADPPQPVTKARSHAARHHRDHSAAAPTEVPTDRDLCDLRGRARARRAELKASSEPMPNEAEPLPDRPPSGPTARAPPRAHGPHGGKRLLPALDVDPRNDDSSIAPSLLQGGWSTTGMGAANTRPVTFFVGRSVIGAQASWAPTTLAALPTRTSRRWSSPARRPDSPHAACARSSRRDSNKALANSSKLGSLGASYSVTGRSGTCCSSAGPHAISARPPDTTTIRHSLIADLRSGGSPPNRRAREYAPWHHDVPDSP